MSATAEPWTPIPDPAPPSDADGRLGWRSLLRASASVAIVASIALMALNRFVGPSMVVLIVLLLVGLWLLRRPTRSGIVTIGAVSLLDVLFHGPLTVFLLPILEYPKGWIPGVVALTASIVNVIAAAAALRGGERRPSNAPRAVAIAAVAVVCVGALASATARLTLTDDRPRAADLRLVAEGNRFSDRRLEAEAGTVSVHMTNDDPIMHTLVVPELDVKLAVPDGTQRRTTFEAPPGEYEFRDEITLGEMRGTLVVR